MRRLALFAQILVLSSTAALEAADPKVVKGPVVCNVQTDRATLLWVTQAAAGEIVAEAGTPQAFEEPVQHSVELRGLKPGTRYGYDLKAYGGEGRGSFVTAPAGDAPFTFAVFGDTRTRHEFHRRIAAKVTAEKPSFVLHTGDLVANGLLSDDWDKFFEIERELLRSTAFFPSLGNHERNTPDFFKYFAFPGGNGHRYSFDWGSAHFIALNSNEVGTTLEDRAAFRREMIAWLKEDLRRTKKPFVFVYFHHPLYSAVENRKASASRLAEQFEQIFIDGGVTAVFAGHDHNYQHHLAKGVHHVVTGGGGAPLYDVSPIPEITLKAVRVENYVKVTIDGSKAKVEAIDIDGNPLESFELNARTLPPPTSGSPAAR